MMVGGCTQRWRTRRTARRQPGAQRREGVRAATTRARLRSRATRSSTNRTNLGPAAGDKPSWEAAAVRPAARGVSANIKHKVKVAALFKSAD